LTPGCSEQGKLPAAKAFKLAERDKHMSEQKINYMTALDQWSDTYVISPLVYSDEGDGEAPDLTEETVEQVKKAIREKVLESYHNGQQLGPRRFVPRRPQGKISFQTSRSTR